MSLPKNGPALIPRAPLRRTQRGDVLVAHWWTKKHTKNVLNFLHAKDSFLALRRVLAVSKIVSKVVFGDERFLLQRMRVITCFGGFQSRLQSRFWRRKIPFAENGPAHRIRPNAFRNAFQFSVQKRNFSHIFRKQMTDGTCMYEWAIDCGSIFMGHRIWPARESAEISWPPPPLRYKASQGHPLFPIPFPRPHMQAPPAHRKLGR